MPGYLILSYLLIMSRSDHPYYESACVTFLLGTRRINLTAPHWRHLLGNGGVRSCGVLKGYISVAPSPFQRKLQVGHNYDITVLQQLGMPFNGIAYLMKCWPFCLVAVPAASGDLTYCSYENIKCEVADVKGIPIDFMAVKCSFISDLR